METSSITDMAATENSLINEKNRERWVVIALSCIQFVHILDFVIMMPLGPQFMRAFSISPAEFSLMISAYTWSGAISGLLSSLFLDRFDRRRAMLFLFSGFLIGTFLCAVAPSHWFFIGARVLAGAFGGVMHATSYAIIGDVFPESRRATATGAIMSTFSLASIIGLPMGLWLSDQWGWHAPFIALVVLGFASWFLAWKALPSVTGHLAKVVKRSHWQQIRTAVAGRPQVLALLFLCSVVLGQFAIIPFLAVYFTSNTGFPESLLALNYFVGGVVTFFTSRMIGRWADQKGKGHVFTIVALASIFPILAGTHLPVVPYWVVVITSATFMILISGRMVPAMSIITSAVPPELRGSFLSISTAVQNFASGSASFLAGWIVIKGDDGLLQHFDWVGYVSVAFTLLALVLVREIGKVKKIG